jgi:hypothetical protein
MQTSRTSKASSSDDDELLLDTEELGVKKKHFLDYDYEPSDSHITATTTAANGKINLSSNASSSKAANQLESRRKIIDRPSTSKMASSLDQQLSNNSVESVYSILSMFGGQNNSSDIASKFLELSKNREMCTGRF